MNKFSFTLDTVLDYKAQILESKQNEHTKALAAQNKQEEIVQVLEAEYSTCKNQLNQKREQGITVAEALTHESYLSHLNNRIKNEMNRFEDLRAFQEKKRGEVVEAKKDTSTIEKLRSKKREEYDKLVQKKSEQFIEEFVSNTMAAGK